MLNRTLNDVRWRFETLAHISADVSAACEKTRQARKHAEAIMQVLAAGFTPSQLDAIHDAAERRFGAGPSELHYRAFAALNEKEFRETAARLGLLDGAEPQ